MFLKRVTVCGFKSFCDRVDFDFGPGVTCIVGPNGCGKSNVVDAFKWVLGEQSARSLRGRQMTDMIFNGSSTRRSSSVAQVDLVFSNTDRGLPLDQEEITVSRKLYRSGESEYLLNQETARLKDIRELFLDTGVGVDSYSVIEQGRVDGLLSSSPQERRLIFEEAAGISRYKARKREAERKLERTQQNLLRVADIIEELEKRLRSVKFAAGKARNFLEYEARLKELRAGFAMAEYHRFTEEIARLTREAESCIDRATAVRTDIDARETEESKLTLALDDLAEQIREADNRLVRAKADLAAQEDRIASARKRSDEQAALLERGTDRLSADGRRAEAGQAELAEAQVLAASLQEQTQSLHAEVDALNEQDRAFARDLTQTQAILEDEKAGVIDLLRQSAKTHNEIIRLNTHRESLVGQKGRLAQRGQQISSELAASLMQRSEMEGRLAEVQALIAEESRRLSEKKAESERVGTVAQRLVEELSQAKEHRSALLSRRDVLLELERKMDGVGAGAARIMEVRKAQRVDSYGSLDCVAGLLADVFEADVAHAKTVEAALGDWDQDLVVTDTDEFLAFLARFGELPGRVTVLCADRLPPIVNERDFSGRPGFVAKASDLVRFSEKFEGLARHLLGKTVVVEGLEDALSAAQTDVAGHRFVTLQGQVVEPDGRVRLGPSFSRAGLISRKSELKDIDGKLAGIDHRVTTLADQINRTQAEVSHLEGVQQELRTAIYESNSAKIEVAAALQNIAETIERLSLEQPLIANEVDLIEKQIDDVLAQSAEGGKSLEALDRKNKEREREVEALQARIDSIVASRRQTQEKLTEVKVAVGQLTEKRAAAAERIHRLRHDLHELETSISALRGDIEQCRQRIAEAQAAINVGLEQAAGLTAAIGELEAASTGLRQQRERLRMDLETLGQSVKAGRGQLAAVEAELHAFQMSLAEANVRRGELSSRVAAELGIDLSRRFEDYRHEDQDWHQVETEIAELRGKMERLGNVNLDAIAEMGELEQRLGFLTGQRDDLVDSQKELEQLIGRLNDESRERFATSFEQIRNHFRTMFRRLFGGGRADIVLEDPENMLDCGIEIVAQPPGKDLQIISLMSGGEKSMTAIALLMSIFQSRPAPFAILDEVDAALDEANNERFNRILQEFVTSTQFIVITHSKWTMNTADQLYGITMQEPGVSTRVSVQLTGANVA